MSVNKPLVLVVDDDHKILRLLRIELTAQGFQVIMAERGEDALQLVERQRPDMVVLDIIMPGMDGLDVLKRIRETSGVPVILLTAKGTDSDKIQGLELGADDYLTKPFSMRELVVRLRALARRPVDGTPPVVEFAALTLDPFRREVFRDGRYVALTRKQFAVLEVLLSARGGVVSAESLLERAWDENADPFTNAVRITISSLRKRLGEPWLISTVPGAGYRIAGPGPGTDRAEAR